MFRAHVLIIRRSKLHYTASGIIKPIGVKKIFASSWLNTEIKNFKLIFSFHCCLVQTFIVQSLVSLPNCVCCLAVHNVQCSKYLIS